ncbi:GDP-fucose O-fucosyltransferase 2-like isoform X2, partial [Paramuricea clavata]
ARRSLVFAKHLRKIEDKFRQEILNSDDEKDSTVTKKDWRKTRRRKAVLWEDHTLLFISDVRTSSMQGKTSFQH